MCVPKGWSGVRTFSHSSWRRFRASSASDSVTKPELMVHAIVLYQMFFPIGPERLLYCKHARNIKNAFHVKLEINVKLISII